MDNQRRSRELTTGRFEEKSKYYTTIVFGVIYIENKCFSSEMFVSNIYNISFRCIVLSHATLSLVSDNEKHWLVVLSTAEC